jgi:hypothetical protein
MPKIDALVAYKFIVDLKLLELLDRLNQIGPWHWMERDSEYYDYISCLGCPTGARLKIFREKDGYVLNLRYKNDVPDAPTVWDGLQRQFLDQILPSLGARDVQLTEGYS